jgi:hypothetical protein
LGVPFDFAQDGPKPPATPPPPEFRCAKFCPERARFLSESKGKIGGSEILSGFAAANKTANHFACDMAGVLAKGRSRLMLQEVVRHDGRLFDDALFLRAYHQPDKLRHAPRERGRAAGS